MSDFFNKVHLQIGKFPLTLHHFTGPDVGDAHDHPFSFTTIILSGGYTEEVWYKGFKGLWSYDIVHREPGTSHVVKATDIHKIIDLPDGECITTVKWHDQESMRREPRFWQFNQQLARSRQWNGDWEDWK